jgi:hypothetical protein
VLVPTWFACHRFLSAYLALAWFAVCVEVLFVCPRTILCVLCGACFVVRAVTLRVAITHASVFGLVCVVWAHAACWCVCVSLGVLVVLALLMTLVVVVHHVVGVIPSS